ncbi:MAG TPA: ribonuclease Z [Thermomicrobiales bacterium]|nr:ribonuclease Z [Thermomicrobiales bacterium]
MIDVMLLGIGSMVPLPGRWLSSALLRIGQSLVLLDCGEGTQVAMRERHWGFRKLDAICLSHLHADHCAGLPGLFHTIGNAGKRTPLTIYGPEGTIDVIRGLRAIAPHLPYDMTVTELADGAETEGPEGLRVAVAEGEHRVPVLAYRLERPRATRFQPDRARTLGVPIDQWSVLQHGEAVVVDGRTVEPHEVLGEAREGVALGFATDTRPTDAVRDVVRGVDLLISEATFGDDGDLDRAIRRGHMTFREAAALARDAEAGHLWLTHFSAAIMDPDIWRDNAAEVFPAVTVGHAGLSATLAFDGGYQPNTVSEGISDDPAVD